MARTTAALVKLFLFLNNNINKRQQVSLRTNTLTHANKHISLFVYEHATDASSHLLVVCFPACNTYRSFYATIRSHEYALRPPPAGRCCLVFFRRQWLLAQQVARCCGRVLQTSVAFFAPQHPGFTAEILSKAKHYCASTHTYIFFILCNIGMYINTCIDVHMYISQSYCIFKITRKYLKKECKLVAVGNMFNGFEHVNKVLSKALQM